MGAPRIISTGVSHLKVIDQRMHVAKRALYSNRSSAPKRLRVWVASVELEPWSLAACRSSKLQLSLLSAMQTAQQLAELLLFEFDATISHVLSMVCKKVSRTVIHYQVHPRHF